MFVLALPVVLPFNLPGAVRDAMKETHTPQTVVASVMGISEQVLDRQLNGIGHLSFGRVLMLATKAETRPMAAKVIAQAITSLRLEREVGVDVVREEVLAALADLPRRPVSVEPRESARRSA
jgi:hypothetical protein